MKSLSVEFAERIIAGLTRKSASTPSQWAEAYRRTKDGLPWSFRRYPWTREMHDSKTPFNVGQKGAQMAFTETVLDVGFHANDVRGVDVLYVLPNQAPDASDFSKARFDSAVEASPRLKAIYSDVCNVGHKRAGTANFYIRGSQSRAGLKSVPVGVLILDELDEMNEKNVPLALERLSGQVEKLVWAISTPTLQGHGINKLFAESSQDHFFFPCPRCSRQIELLFPDCLEVVGDDPENPRVHESVYRCPSCRGDIPHAGKVDFLKTGTWQATIQDREKRGWWIPQQYSTTITPGELAISWLKSRQSPADEQEFWNSKQGLPHEVEGARISDAQIEAALGPHLNSETIRDPNKVVTMGIDVGKVCHWEVCEWTVGRWVANDVNVNSTPRVLACGRTQGLSFDQLDALMCDWQVNMCVIDAQPERRAAFRFASRFNGYVKMCFYGRGGQGKFIQEHKGDEGEPLITVDRTSWLDQALGRFKGNQIVLPRDCPNEYREHLKAIVRVFAKDANGNPVGSYVTPENKADHHAHARCYSEIALQLAVSVGNNQDAEDIL